MVPRGEAGRCAHGSAESFPYLGCKLRTTVGDDIQGNPMDSFGEMINYGEYGSVTVRGRQTSYKMAVPSPTANASTLDVPEVHGYPYHNFPQQDRIVGRRMHKEQLLLLSQRHHPRQ